MRQLITLVDYAHPVIPVFMVLLNWQELPVYFFFFQAEDGIRDFLVTGVQTCALPISLLGLGVHVRDLDPADDPDGDADRERDARLVGVNVDLERIPVSDDEQRVSERLQLRLDSLRVEIIALDHEPGAIAIARELLVCGLDPDLLVRRRFGQLLTGRRGRDSAEDLDESRRPRIDDSGLAQHVEHLPRACDTVLAAPDDRREEDVDILDGSPALGLLCE